MSRYPSLAERILANVYQDPISGCWIWTGKAGKGRGGSLRAKINVWEAGEHKTLNVTRVVLRIFKGVRLRRNQEAGHTPGHEGCTLCVAPHHLSPQSRLVNQRQEAAARRARRAS